MFFLHHIQYSWYYWFTYSCYFNIFFYHSINKLLFIYNLNVFFTSSIHCILNLSLPIIHILWTAIHIETIAVMYHNDILIIFPSKSRQHIVHTWEWKFEQNSNFLYNLLKPLHNFWMGYKSMAILDIHNFQSVYGVRNYL